MLHAREIYQNYRYKIIINKTKVEVYREALRDVSQNFEGAENPHSIVASMSRISLLETAAISDF